MMNDKNTIPVKDHKHLFRDKKSKSIINTNKSDYETYVRNRDRMNSDKERISNLEEKVDSLQGDISDIKNLLLKIVDK